MIEKFKSHTNNYNLKIPSRLDLNISEGTYNFRQ